MNNQHPANSQCLVTQASRLPVVPTGCRRYIRSNCGVAGTPQGTEKRTTAEPKILVNGYPIRGPATAHRVEICVLRDGPHCGAGFLVLCQAYRLGLIGRKRARCKEAGAKTGSVDPLSRCDAADGPFATNPTGGGQGAVSFGACRQCMGSYTFLLTSRPQPPGPPSILICRLDRALARPDLREQLRFFLGGNLLHLSRCSRSTSPERPFASPRGWLGQ